MGREVRRVPANFDWEIGKTWEGFVNPYTDHVKPCHHCDRMGVNPATLELYHTFYDSRNNRVTWEYRFEDGRAVELLGTTKRWQNQLTQDEYDALRESRDFKHPMTLEEFNRQNTHPTKGYNFDACDMWLMVRTRAERLGVYGKCEHCNGSGSIWDSKAWEALADAWKPIPVPEGEWWQVWETVSEGSPITPAFATADELVHHLVNKGTSWRRDGYTREQAEAFVKSGYVPSMVIKTNSDGTREFLKDIEAATLGAN